MAAAGDGGGRRLGAPLPSRPWATGKQWWGGAGEGPIGVVVAPTRELAEQIHKECRRFGKSYGLRMCAAFGGLSKLDQFKDLKAGSEVPPIMPRIHLINPRLQLAKWLVSPCTHCSAGGSTGRGDCAEVMQTLMHTG